LAVLRAVYENPHTETQAVIDASRREIGWVSHQTVYDALEAFSAAGLVRRFQPMGAVTRYEARIGDNHHHVVCRTCESIADVDCARGLAPCLSAADDAGYRIEEAEVIYWGQCPSCLAEQHRARGTSEGLRKGEAE
jgi:Fur family ferric uptake transcriptional regulator